MKLLRDLLAAYRLVRSQRLAEERSLHDAELRAALQREAVRAFGDECQRIQEEFEAELRDSSAPPRKTTPYLRKLRAVR